MYHNDFMSVHGQAIMVVTMIMMVMVVIVVMTTNV
jgi:hypothetical protein